MRDIKEGDEVTVVWTDREKVIGIVENVPQATGDLWYIHVKDQMGERIVAVNPNNSTLDCIVKDIKK